MKNTTFLSLIAIFGISGIQMYAQDSLFLKETLQKWQNAVNYTLEVAQAMPLEKFDFKPMNEEFTFGQQLLHIGENMTWLAGDYLRKQKFDHPLKGKKELNPAEIMELLKASLIFAQSAIEQTPSDSLSITKSFFAGPMSRRQIIVLMHDHHTHHRAQLLVYLRLNGIKPPKYRGW